MQAFVYYASLPFIYGLSLLPFWVIHRVSDLLYFFIYYLFGYRKEVVRRNLTSSFPEKSPKELREIERDFYHCFCDDLVETIKILTLSPAGVRKRMTFSGEKLYEKYAQKKQNIILVMGHLGNWELSAPRFALSTHFKLFIIYHPLHNPYFNRMITHMRTRWGNEVYTMKEAARSIIRNKDIHSATIFVADQTPSPQRAYWMDFLNQDTAVIRGPGRLAKKMNYPVVYVGIKRIKRGYYDMYMKELVPDPSHVSAEEIVEKFIRQLESDIRKDPAIWLWSHKRWKHKREVKREAAMQP